MNWPMSRWPRWPPSCSSRSSRRAGGESGHYRDHQPALLRVAAGLYQCPAVQGGARSAHRSGPHYRNRLGVVPFSQDLAEETQRVIPGGRCSILLPLRPTGYAPAERNSILLTFNVPGWARLNRRNGPNQLAKSSSQYPVLCGQIFVPQEKFLVYGSGDVSQTGL